MLLILFSSFFNPITGTAFSRISSVQNDQSLLHYILSVYSTVHHIALKDPQILH